MKAGDLVKLPPTVIANNALGECVGVVLKKEERHHIGEQSFEQPDRTMSAIGG